MAVPMHELPITESILSIALDAAGASRVLAINLVVGDLSVIANESVQFYFDFLSKGTPAEDAALRFRRIPSTIVCSNCGGNFTLCIPLLPYCPDCGSTSLHVTGGREMRVDSIEVDDTE